MYNHVRDELVDDGLVIEREAYAWMDTDGNIVQETNTFGCRVTHTIDGPDWVLVMYEVVRNIN